MGLVTIVRLKTGNSRSYLTSGDIVTSSSVLVLKVIASKHVIIVIKVKIVIIGIIRIFDAKFNTNRIN